MTISSPSQTRSRTMPAIPFVLFYGLLLYTICSVKD